MSCFIYYGHFYRLTIDGTEYCCRSTLEIVSSRNRTLTRAADQDPIVLLDRRRQPNAVFVMLNPGGSHPCNGRLGNRITNPGRINNDAKSNLVLTCPDDTQQAVEKVMMCKQFDHVRVLNLFDIRERDSAELINIIRASLGHPRRLPSRQPEIKSYSIFSNERQHESISRLNARNSIVIAAWGTKKARPYFSQICQILEGLNLQIHGWRSAPNAPNDRGFYHPSRRQEEWPRYIIENWPNEQGALCEGQDVD